MEYIAHFFWENDVKSFMPFKTHAECRRYCHLIGKIKKAVRYVDGQEVILFQKV